jgi:hypothetical protein
MQACVSETLTCTASTLQVPPEQKWSLTQSLSEEQLVLHAVALHA